MYNMYMLIQFVSIPISLKSDFLAMSIEMPHDGHHLKTCIFSSCVYACICVPKHMYSYIIYIIYVPIYCVYW